MHGVLENARFVHDIRNNVLLYFEFLKGSSIYYTRIGGGWVKILYAFLILVIFKKVRTGGRRGSDFV